MFNTFPSFNQGMQFNYMPESSEFKENYRMYPISYLPNSVSTEKKNLLNNSGRIILPPSALTRLSFLEISYPMLFEIQSNVSFKLTNTGVLEFIAEEGRVYIPDWMIDQLEAPITSTVTVKSVTLPKASFVKLEPQSVDFLEIENPKIVLERCLRNYSALRIDDIINIEFNDTVYKIKITDLKPNPQGSCIVETDLVTDFDPPKGYVEPDYKKMQEDKQREEEEKRKNMAEKDPDVSSMSKRLFIPALNKPLIGTAVFKNDGVRLNDGVLFFGFPYVPPNKGTIEDEEDLNNNFAGEGQKLKKKNKRKINRQGNNGSITDVNGDPEHETRKSPRT
ncbi:unnamed protein product [Hanseniaspora opuntiae]